MKLKIRIYALQEIYKPKNIDNIEVDIEKWGEIKKPGKLKIKDEAYKTEYICHNKTSEMLVTEELKECFIEMLNKILKTIVDDKNDSLNRYKDGLSIYNNQANNTALIDSHGAILYHSSACDFEVMFHAVVQNLKGRIIKTTTESNTEEILEENDHWGRFVSEIDNLICLLELKGNTFKNNLYKEIYKLYISQLPESKPVPSEIEEWYKPYYFLLMKRWFVLKMLLTDLKVITPGSDTAKETELFLQFLPILNPIFEE